MTGRLYDTQRWKRLRRKQLARQPLCQACQTEGTVELATDVDHIQRIEDGGAKWSMDNLQSLCHAHHSIKTNNYDMAGKDWKQWELRGCDETGNPRDPEHDWHRGGSITTLPVANTGGNLAKRFNLETARNGTSRQRR